MADTDGFGPDAQRFLRELAEHNDREFFRANRERFDRELAEPMQALLDSLPERYQPFRVFRMNRDIRFTKDKSPYKTQHSAIAGRGAVQYYLHIDAEGFLAATGSYVFSSEQLDAYRSAVLEEKTGARLESIMVELGRKRSLRLDQGAPALRSAPRGVAADHPRIELLRRKGLIGSRGLTGTDLRSQAKVRRFVVDTFRMCADLDEWLAALG